MDKSIYKSGQFKKELMNLYDERLKAMNCSHTSKFIDTSFGKTHVLCVGDESLPPVIVLHGINAGAPMALESIANLSKSYRLFGVDTLGQVGRSDEHRLSMKDNSYGDWLSEVVEKLGISQAPMVGVSYGAYILQKLMATSPEKISKAIFIVPSGFVNGPFWPSTKHLTIPLIRFFLTKSDETLRSFMEAFYTEITETDLKFQKNVLLGVHVDYSRPKILQKSHIPNFSAPVYAIVANDEIFFPGDITLKRCQEIFDDFRDSYVLNSKHIPARGQYKEISDKIELWLQDS